MTDHDETMTHPDTSGREPAITVDDVIVACRTLPTPVWHRILDAHPRPRMAATLVPVVDVDGAAALVVTKRAGGLDHGDDWVFPGGGVDAGDASAEEAARRETAEELGIRPDQITVIGQLARRGPIITGWVIDNFVGVLEPGVALAPEAGEVAAIELVPIAALLAADGHHRGPARLPKVEPHRVDPELAARIARLGDLRDLRYYRVTGDEHLWGLQADIVHELLVHLTAGGHDC